MENQKQNSSLNLFKKIHKIIEENVTVIPTGEVKYGKTNFTYAKESDIFQALRPIFTRYNLVCTSSSLETNVLEELTTCIMEFKLTDLDSGEIATFIHNGQGQDKNDKGASKAETDAMKTFLKKTFMLNINEVTTSSVEVEEESNHSIEERSSRRSPSRRR